ncbi:hypothetical protein D1872_226260 [compost metagenome]
MLTQMGKCRNEHQDSQHTEQGQRKCEAPLIIPLTEEADQWQGEGRSNEEAYIPPHHSVGVQHNAFIGIRAQIRQNRGNRSTDPRVQNTRYDIGDSSIGYLG